MKKIFLILVLINVFLFAFMQSGRNGWNKQENLILTPINENKIRLLEMSKIEQDKIVSAQIADQNFRLQPKSSEAGVPMNKADQIAAKQDSLICIEWGDFSGIEKERASAALLELQLENKLSQREIELDTGFWVYMPPKKSKREVSKKIGELKELGINDYFVVPTGQLKNAISLGVFKTKEAAESHLDQLRKRGVRTAKIGEHDSKIVTTWFVLSGVNSETKDKIIKIQKNFEGSRLENVPCTLTR